jgi:hypothetical protein
VLIVTGTKRSGTSLWMQILIAAGFPAFGEAFPGEWRRTLARANVDGFYESLLREGIYHATNPHPITGDYFFPEQVQWHCVKVFVPGLVRTDRAYIGHVIATVRAWREHEASLNRLLDIEASQRPERTDTAAAELPPRLAPPLEWWSDNFALVRDIAIRRYPVHVVSYDTLLCDPERTITETLGWIGRGDVQRACEQVRPERRNFLQPESTTVSPEVAAVFDELYAAIHSGRALPAGLLQKLNETNDRLQPAFAEYEQAIARYRKTLEEGDRTA